MEHNPVQAAAVGFEADRNRLLRRADWRFLLPDSNPRRTACFTGERLAQAVSLISEEVVTPAEALPESCDLVVVSNPDARTIRAAWKSLCPGGVFYGEWYSPWMGGPPQIHRKLAQAGFDEIAFYWPWPCPDRSSTLFWLPLEAPAALDYFLRTRPPSRSFMQEIGRMIMRKAWRAARWVRLLVPVCVTARKRTAEVPGQQNPGDELIEEMQRAWINWDADCQPGSLHWLMLTGGLTSLNKVVKFGFRRDEPLPCLVVKSARVPESIPGLVREGQNLDLLARLPGGGPPNVPHLLFMDRTQETAEVGESVVSGNPLYTHLRKDNYRLWALKATVWLGQLVKPEDRIPRSDWWARIAEPALEAFDRLYSRELSAGWIDRIKDRLLPLQSLPLAFEHRDFSPWNVLVTDAGELAVLDWEGGEPNGMPGMDLIYFMTFLAFFHDGAMETGQFLPAYRASQDPLSFTGSVQAECFRIYFDYLRHDPAIALPLRTLAWTIHSLSVFPRLGRQAARDGAAEPGLFIQLLGEELKGTWSVG